MKPAAPRCRRVFERACAFASDRRGSSAVEFAIVSLPFILMLLGILQLGIYYMTQSALDAGVVRTADYIMNSYYSTAAPFTPSASDLQTMVAANASGLVRKDTTLAVDLRRLSALATAVSPITNVVDTAAAGDVLALRAQAAIISIVPGMGTMYARSAALVRRQGQ